MAKDLLDDVLLVGFDEGDDLHRAAALGAAERVGVVDVLDEGGPAAAGFGGRERVARRQGGRFDPIRASGGGEFGSPASGLVRVVPEVANQVLALVGDVLGEFGQEVQGLEELEVPADSGQEVAAGGFGVLLRMVLLGLVEDLAFGGDADETGEAEGAAEDVLCETFEADAVSGVEEDAAVDAEPAMPPGADLGDDGRLDAVLGQEEVEDLVLPEAEERGVGEVVGEAEEAAVGSKGAIGDQGVDVGVEVNELAEGLDGEDGAGSGVIAEEGAIDLQEGLPSQFGQAVEQGAVEAEEDAEAFGDGPDELAVGNIEADVLGDVEGEEDVHNKLLYYCVCAWQEDFTGFVIDYGTFPEQSERIFALDNARRTLGRAFPGAGPDGAIQAGLEKLISTYLARDFRRGEGLMRIDRLLVDMGYKPGIVAAVKHKAGGSAMMLYKGLGIRAGHKPLSTYARRPGEQHGHFWFIPNVSRTSEFPHVAADVNYWKTFTHNALATSAGDAGSLTMFGQAREHELFAQHIAASEMWTETQGHGRTVHEWTLLGSKPDNHWLDCLAGCAVAASMLGIGRPGEQAPRRQRKRYTQEDLRSR